MLGKISLDTTKGNLGTFMGTFSFLRGNLCSVNLGVYNAPSEGRAAASAWGFPQGRELIYWVLGEKGKVLEGAGGSHFEFWGNPRGYLRHVHVEKDMYRDWKKQSCSVQGKRETERAHKSPNK